MFVCVCESWIAQEEEIFCIVCFLSSWNICSFFLFFESENLVGITEMVFRVCDECVPDEIKVIFTQSDKTSQGFEKKRMGIKLSWNQKQNNKNTLFKLICGFKRTFLQKQKRVLLIGLIVLRMWTRRSAQCLRNQWHTTKKLEVIKKVFFQKHCFGSTFQPTQFELPQQFWSTLQPKPHKLFNQSQENDHFDHQVFTLPKSKLRVCLQELSGTYQLRSQQRHQMQSNPKPCPPNWLFVWHSLLKFEKLHLFDWNRGLFQKRTRKIKFQFRSLRKWTCLFCLCVCSFFLVDLFMSFVFLFCFSVWFSFNSNKQSFDCKMMKQKNQNQNRPKPSWCELEKRTDQQ